MDFAVSHEGIKEGQGRWVLGLDVTKERVLLAGEDGVFYWKPLSECKFLKAATPDMPRLVLPVQAQPQPGGLVVPNLNGRN